MTTSKFQSSSIIINQSLPHNFIAEKMVLNCLIINSEAIELTLKTLPVEAFYFKNHQEIYKAISFMYENRVSINLLSLITFLQDNGLLQQIGGIKVLIELVSQLPNLIYLEDYLALINEKFIRRKLIKLGYALINSSYLTNLPLDSVLTNLENQIFNLNLKAQKQNLSTSAEVLNSIFSDLKIKYFNPNITGLSSGFYDLDSLTQGFQKSDLIVIAGRPSIGKTALGLNIISNISKNTYLPILFFSLEMSKQQIMYRLLSIETNISQMRLKTGRFSQDNWIKLNKISKILSKLPIFIDDSFNLKIQDIRAKIKSIIFEQNQIGLIVIDYLQLIHNPNNTNENRVQELSGITRSLKILAREFNVPIIALSQLSRNVENRIDKRPILSDLRESGSIEQDADLVLLLHKTNQNLPTQKSNSILQSIEIIIAKQRNGPIGSMNLKFDDRCTKFFDINV